jgi:hypothetical protein
MPDRRPAVGRSLKKSTRIFPDTSEDLVWRRNPPPATNSEIRSNLNTAGVVEPRSVNTTGDDAPAGTVSPSINRTQPQPITKLDPALVDRLTDDVIRRVEQRARIERQRRGL